MSLSKIQFAHTALCAAVVLSSSAAFGQVTLYGRIDTGVEHLTNVGASGGSLWRMPSLSGSSPSLWGIRAVEDLGDGMKAEAILESGFAPNSGTHNQGGRGFGRRSTVGLRGNWGEFSVGRQSTMYYWITTKTELLGPNIYGAAQLDSYYAGPRADNSVSYMGSFGPVTVGATYSLGRDAVGSAAAGGCAGDSSVDSKACTDMSLMFKYDASTWGVGVAQDAMRGGAGAMSINGAPTPIPGFTSDKTDRRTVVNGYTVVGPVTLSAQHFVRENDAAAASTTLTRKSNIWELGASWQVTPAVVLAGELARLKYEDSADGSGANLIAVRAMYWLSKRTAAYVNVSRLQNRGSANLSVSGGTSSGTAPGAGERQSGMMVGMRHSF